MAHYGLWSDRLIPEQQWNKFVIIILMSKDNKRCYNFTEGKLTFFCLLKIFDIMEHFVNTFMAVKN